MIRPVPAAALERCLHRAGLRGAVVPAYVKVLSVPGVGDVIVEMAPGDPRGRRVWATGLTHNGTDSHRSIWRFAQLLACRTLVAYADMQRLVEGGDDA
ncbi:MAG: hypothetical protein Q8Q14_05315 [Gemmatimonadales bacterium]|nr:hypothetical protein [Gemmatimonadales bacterium]